MKRFPLGALALCITIALSACGGGGGSPGLPAPSSSIPEPTFQMTREMRTAPSAERVVGFLQHQASGGPFRSSPTFTYTQAPGLVRFANPPTVRINHQATDREQALTYHAVSLVNRVLPYAQHIRIGRETTLGPNPRLVPTGEIVVAFLDGPANNPGDRPGSWASTDLDVDIRNGVKVRLRASDVWMDRRGMRGHRDHVIVGNLAHELLHALGLPGHPNQGDFDESVMFNPWPGMQGKLPAIDAAALQALYGRLDAQTDPEAISVESLGPWTSQADTLMGRLGAVTFGVTRQNEFEQAWTLGSVPATDLANNPALRGTVTWDGGIVGFSSDQQAVTGESSISVNLSTMTGQAAFTELEANGASWGPGSLDYDLTVSGNYLRSTGGDAGMVNGTFYGQQHEGVGGVVERSDFTGAFGGRR